MYIHINDANILQIPFPNDKVVSYPNAIFLSSAEFSYKLELIKNNN